MMTNQINKILKCTILKAGIALYRLKQPVNLSSKKVHNIMFRKIHSTNTDESAGVWKHWRRRERHSGPAQLLVEVQRADEIFFFLRDGPLGSGLLEVTLGIVWHALSDTEDDFFFFFLSFLYKTANWNCLSSGNNFQINRS